MQKLTVKTLRLAFLLGSASLLTAALSLHAGDSNSSGFYIGTDLGVNLADKLTTPSLSISLDPGLRWDVSMGYAIKLSDQFTLAPELETGILYNSLDKGTLTGGSSVPVSGEYFQVPLLANLVLNWHFTPHWVAYAGAGGGFDADTLNVSSVNNTPITDIGSEVDAAWQVEAGVRYKFGGSSDLGLGYEYLAATPNGLKTVGNSAILASYTFHF
jgi:opacity protein-like surface antigen